MTAEASSAHPVLTPEQILSQAPAVLEEALTLLDRADRNALPPPDRERVYGMIHKLAGTTDSVGMHDVARAATDLGRTVGPWLRDGDQDRPPWKIPFKALAMAMADARSAQATAA